MDIFKKLPLEKRAWLETTFQKGFRKLLKRLARASSCLITKSPQGHPYAAFQKRREQTCIPEKK